MIDDGPGLKRLCERRNDVSGLQPSGDCVTCTWAFGPGWYVSRLWR